MENIETIKYLLGENKEKTWYYGDALLAMERSSVDKSSTEWIEDAFSLAVKGISNELPGHEELTDYAFYLIVKNGEFSGKKIPVKVKEALKAHPATKNWFSN